MSKDSHVIAQNAHSISVREGEKFRFSSSWKNLIFQLCSLISLHAVPIDATAINIYHVCDLYC